MRLTENERAELWGMQNSFKDESAILNAVGEFRQGINDALSSGDGSHLQRATAGIQQLKAIFQVVHNYAHTTAMLSAKAFLEQECHDVPWEQIEFADHANKSGLDLNLGEFRIVAEVKTTEPCGQSTFGANQKENVRKDLAKLNSPKYVTYRRFMFVTSPLAYHRLVKDYRQKFPDICFVLLSALREVSRPLAPDPPKHRRDELLKLTITAS